jgi:hypothetical protein
LNRMTKCIVSRELSFLLGGGTLSEQIELCSFSVHYLGRGSTPCQIQRNVASAKI